MGSPAYGLQIKGNENVKRVDAVLQSTEKLVAAENAVGAAFSLVARFAGELEDMRMAAGLSAVIGQEALAEVAQAVSLLTEARGAMVRAHGRLDEVKTRIGCRTVLGSNGSDKGDNSPTGPTLPTGELERKHERIRRVA